MSAPGVRATIDADPSPFFRALREVELSTKNTFNRVEGSVNALTGPINAVMGGFGRLSSILGAGAMVLAGRQAIQMGDDMNKAAIKAGVTGEAMSSLGYAARMADVDLKSLSTSLRFMQVNLSEAGSGAKAPIATLQALGLTFEELHRLAPDKQFELLADRISKLRDPADRARAATELFGRTGADLLPMFEQGAAGIRAAREEAEKLGLVVSAEQLQKLSESDDAIKRLSTSWEHFGMVITSKVAPPLQQLLDMLSGKGNPMTKSGADMTKSDALLRLQAAINIKRANWDMNSPEMKRILEGQIAQLEEQMRQLREGSSGTRGGPGRIAITPGGWAGSSGKPTRTVREREIAEVSVSDTVRLGERQAAEGRKAFDASRAMEQDALDHQREMAQAALDTEEQKLDRMAELGQISNAQQLQGYLELAERRYEVDRLALARRAADLNAEPLERQQANQAIELLEVQHQQRMAELRARMRAQIAQPWNQLFGSMQAGFQSVLTTFMRGYASIGTTLRGLFASVLNAFTDMMAKILAQWLTMKLAQLFFSKSTIAGKAAEAGAGGVASMAGAPFPLNLGAPAFGAAMAALAGAYLAIPSAAGGWDIPRGINPVVQAHSGEMVLPEKHADVIRSMADGHAAAGSSMAPFQLKVYRLSPGEVAVKEKDLMSALSRLGGRNFRPS